MKKIVTFVGTSLIIACSNPAYQQPAQKSELVGTFSKSRIFLTATNTTVLHLREDGTGFECFYSNENPQPKKTPIKHIGGGQWASATLGTGLIEKVSDNSIKWGAAGIFIKTKMEDTSCSHSHDRK